MFQQRSRTRTLIPAALASVAYVDPGNFGVNLASGAKHGYALVWVVVLASVMATLVQYLSATLGLASGMNLAQVCRARYRTPMRMVLWVQAEIVVIMTDLAEIVGGALACNLLFGWPIVPSAILVAAFSVAVVALRSRGTRAFEGIILGFLGVLVLSLGVILFGLGAEPGPLAAGLVPGPLGDSALVLAVGVVGATVMPHAVHFHSAVSRPSGSPLDSARHAREIRESARWARHTGGRVGRSVVLAMGLAALANLTLMIIGTHVPASAADDLPLIRDALALTGGRGVAILFGVALLASGLAATVVGVHTGQVVTAGFLNRPVPPVVRRAVGSVPPIVLLLLGVDPMQGLVLSQVALSLTLPATLIPLVIATGDRAVMGRLVTRGPVRLAAIGTTVVIVAMNLLLLATFATSA